MSTPRGTSAARGAAGSAVQTPTTGGRQQQHNNGPSSAGPASVGNYRTPNTATKTAVGGRRTPGTAGRTPHARAARLALDSRRTAIFTPGGRQSRRKSGRMLRDSPRDLLRNLSRRLAPISQPIASSSSPGSSGGSAQQSRRHRQPLDIDMEMDDMMRGGPDSRTTSATRRRTIRSVLGIDDDDDDSLPLDRPRMSLNIEDNDNDDDLRPHRSMILENSDDAEADADADLANFTQRSIELARRAATQEQLLQARRFSRASLGVRSSFGSMRMSDYMDEFGRGADAEGGGENDDDVAARLEQTSAFFPEGAFDNLMPGESPPGANMTFERVDSDTGEQHEARLGVDGRESGGFGVIDLGLDGGNETTFMLGQQSPDRTLGTLLVEGDGENEPGLLGGGDGMGEGADFGAGFDNFDDYGSGGGDDNGGGGNFWDDDDEENGNAADGAPVSAHDGAAQKLAGVVQASQEKRSKAGKRLKLSAHGIAYPSLPVGVIKRIAQTFAQSSGSGKAKLSPETVAALSTASDWFFEQVGVDLQRYAKHGGRKTIDESDVLLLMRRQRQVNAAVTPFSLAQRMLPRELLQELRMIPDAPALKRQRQNKQNKPAQRLSAGVGRIAKKRANDVT